MSHHESTLIDQKHPWKPVRRPTTRRCHWKFTDGIWYTGCGDAWADGRHGSWRFCPLCGLALAPQSDASAEVTK